MFFRKYDLDYPPKLILIGDLLDLWLRCILRVFLFDSFYGLIKLVNTEVDYYLKLLAAFSSRMVSLIASTSFIYGVKLSRTFSDLFISSLI